MLSNKFKKAGLFFIACGIGLTTLYSVNRLDLSVPVFAVQSSYLSTKYFTVTHNNIFEELIILSFLAGFMMTAFSKEKVENDEIRKMRGEAWIKAIVANAGLLLFFTLFIFGRSFMLFLFVNLFSPFAFFHLFFWLKKRKMEKKSE
jgi:hypothetical protein